MRISLKVIVYLITAARLSLLSVTQNKGGPANINCGNTPVRQTAYLGGSVTINCQYPRTEENIKLFCREDEKFHCKDLISTYKANYTKRDRFSLTDDKHQGVFTVIISTVTQEDAGRYQCATQRANDSSVLCYTEINLNILTWNDFTPTVTYGVTGESIHINCSYLDSSESNYKFLCKGANPLNCKELISTTEHYRNVVNDRFSIRDNKRKKYFYVYIKNLTTTDSGTYWCGSDKTRQQAEYTKIHLSVAERHIKTTTSGPPALPTTQANHVPSPPSPSDDAPDLNNHLNALVIVGVVSLALLAMALVVLILCRHKLPWRQGESSEQRTNTGHNTEGNHEDHHYEEVQMRNEQASSGDALPSIYATVSPHTDQLHYACVTFSHPPAAEQTLYSTVTKPK